MSELVVQNRSAEWYFEVYGREGIGKGMDRIMVRDQMIRTIENEIFSLASWRLKKKFKTVPPEGDPEAIRIVKNIIKDEVCKWIKICKIFDKYKETSGLINPEDLSNLPNLNVEDIYSNVTSSVKEEAEKSNE